MSSPWLTARLTHIVLVNYRVPASLLLPYVPRGSELDTPERAPDLHLLSLVALRLSRARLYGLPIPLPTARSLPQLNLRFYFRRGPMR
ncbi:MAG: DUF2071 domain-containing protein, partial [Chloroflexi bacterium]|nr:DUF2071 domain-containing protein [Chloroflexota bacterium]